MQHILSTHLFVNQRLTTAGLDRVRGAGFSGVEIFCARQHLDYYDKAPFPFTGHVPISVKPWDAVNRMG